MKIESSDTGTARDTDSLYLEVMKKVLSGALFANAPVACFRQVSPTRNWRKIVYELSKSVLAVSGLALVRMDTERSKYADEGTGYNEVAYTMIGLKRLNNLQLCCEEVIRDRVPGDFIETGVWRGGAVIFMRAILKAHGIGDRCVWAADSFAGLPPPNPMKYPVDLGDRHHTLDHLRVSLDQVRSNFAAFGLLDSQVKFLKGWFSDTLPYAPIERLAVLRLDGDMYESTMDTLVNLYPKLSRGGFVIVDDYALPGCQMAVEDFRTRNSITEEMKRIDWTGVYWRRVE